MSFIKDIQREIREINTTDRMIRKFGIALLILTLIVGWFFWHKDQSFWFYIPAAGLFIAVLSLVFCPAVRCLYYPLAVIGVVLGFFISKMILGLMFYTFFSFVGVFTRLFGIDLLKKKIRKSKNSYWDTHQKISEDPKQYENLF